VAESLTDEEAGATVSITEAMYYIRIIVTDIVPTGPTYPVGDFRGADMVFYFDGEDWHDLTGESNYQIIGPVPGSALYLGTIQHPAGILGYENYVEEDPGMRNGPGWDWERPTPDGLGWIEFWPTIDNSYGFTSTGSQWGPWMDIFWWGYWQEDPSLWPQTEVWGHLGYWKRVIVYSPPASIQVPVLSRAWEHWSPVGHPGAPEQISGTLSAPFIIGERVSGNVSGAVGVVLAQTEGTITITVLVGTFDIFEIIAGALSGSTVMGITLIITLPWTNPWNCITSMLDGWSLKQLSATKLLSTGYARVVKWDITNPDVPVIDAEWRDYDVFDSALGSDVVGNLIYIANFAKNELLILDTDTMTVVGSLVDDVNLWKPTDVKVVSYPEVGTFAFVGVGRNWFGEAKCGVTVVDVTNPATPVVVGGIYDLPHDNGPFSPLQLAVSRDGKYLYEVESENFHVIGITDPYFPVLVGYLHDEIVLSGGRGIALRT
jgi:hypothetical protein